MSQPILTPLRGDEENYARTKETDRVFTNGDITKAALSDGHWSVSYLEDAEPPRLPEELALGSMPDTGRCAMHVGWSTDKADDGAPEPKVGDRITIYGSLGRPIWGIDINGEQVYYKTGEQMHQERLALIAQHDEEKRQRFEIESAQLDEQYGALLPIFQRRIDRFRQTDPNWRVEYEAYEMFVCVEACKLIRWVEDCRARVSNPKPEVRDLLHEYYDNAGSEEWRQKHVGVPHDDGHSGNSFGKTVLFAQIYFDDHRFVPFAHGAMTGLVSCEDFGCHGSKAIWMDELEALAAESEAAKQEQTA